MTQSQFSRDLRELADALDSLDDTSPPDVVLQETVPALIKVATNVHAVTRFNVYGELDLDYDGWTHLVND